MHSIRDLPSPSSASSKKAKWSIRLCSSSVSLVSRIPRRLQYLLALAITTFGCLWLFYDILFPGIPPPNYYAWHDMEKALPQNDLNLPLLQGRHGRYIRFNNHVTSTHTSYSFSIPVFTHLAGFQEVGWGNSMQEMIVNAHVAYRSNRMCVRCLTCATHTHTPDRYTMYNYTWDNHIKSDYSRFSEGFFKHTKIPARIPITAIAAGASLSLPPFTLPPHREKPARTRNATCIHFMTRCVSGGLSNLMTDSSSQVRLPAASSLLPTGARQQ
jgi:hypothetical protein